MDRSIQPIQIDDNNGLFTNKLNSFRDHSASGNYVGQKRMSRFVTQIATEQDEYTLDPTGTVPMNMRFTLRALQGGVQIKIPYNDAFSLIVTVDN